MKRYVSLLLIILFISSSAVWASSAPMEQVREIIDSVQTVLERDDLSIENKKAEVSELVQSSLPIRSISQRVLGVHWKKATPQQRDEFSKLFIQVLEKTYLNRIEDYSGGHVEYLKERIKGKKAIVDTKFVTETVEVPVQYKMLHRQGVWQIYDVVIEGVSLVSNYRSSYSEIVSNKGFDGLFAMMERKLAEQTALGEKQ